MNPDEFTEIEYTMLAHGIKGLTCLNGDAVPRYELNMMSFLKMFPDCEIWEVKGRQEWPDDTVEIRVAFNEREIACVLNPDQEAYIRQRYGYKFEEEDKEDETV